MSKLRWMWASAGIVVLFVGCRSTSPEPNAVVPAAATPGRCAQSEAPSLERPPMQCDIKRTSLRRGEAPVAHPALYHLPKRVTIVPVTHQQPDAEHVPPSPIEPAPLAPTVADDDGLVVEGDQLSLSQLVAEVEARNPSLQAMFAAWQAAAQKYPQAVAFDDPMFMAMLAPSALGDREVFGGQQLQASQRFPWPGKRRARGDMAQSEADAAYHEAEDFRAQLALMSHTAFYDYYLVLQLRRLNQDNTKILERFRESAQVRYENNLVTQQDVFQADLELAELERRDLELRRMQQVAIARINTLLLRQPDAPLANPEALPEPSALQDASLVIGIALSQRQDLAALAHRIEIEEAGLDLAHKEYFPDVDLIGAYNAMMPEKEMWGQVGVLMNVPLYWRKRRAAVGEAEFRISQRVAEYEQKQLDIQYDVQAAHERLEESRLTVELYRQKLIPSAEQNVAAARANYENAKATFLDLAIAQRQLVELQEKELEAQVAYHQRLAELQRAIGGQ